MLVNGHIVTMKVAKQEFPLTALYFSQNSIMYRWTTLQEQATSKTNTLQNKQQQNNKCYCLFFYSKKIHVLYCVF